MRKINFFLLMLPAMVFGVFCTAGPCGPPGRKIKNLSYGDNKSNLSGQLRRLEEEAEDLDRKMRRIKPESKKYATMTREREKLALDIVHTCQRYLENRRGKTDSRTEQVMRMMKSEAVYLKNTVSKIKDFPVPQMLTNVDAAIDALRAGKVTFSGKVGRNDAATLREVQKLQRKALENYHKGSGRNSR